MFGVGAPPSHHTVKLDGHRHSSSKDITPLNDFARPRDQGIM